MSTLVLITYFGRCCRPIYSTIHSNCKEDKDTIEVYIATLCGQCGCVSGKWDTRSRNVVFVILFYLKFSDRSKLRVRDSGASVAISTHAMDSDRNEKEFNSSSRDDGSRSKF